MPLTLPTGHEGKRRKNREQPARFYQAADELAYMVMEERDAQSRSYLCSFQEKLDILQKSMNENNMKDSMLRLLLCVAARNNNMDAFRMLLTGWEPEEKEGVVRIPVRFPINSKLIPHVKKIYQYLQEPVKKTAFMADQPRYLDMLLQKLEIRSHGLSVRRVEWKDRVMDTNAPDIYVAILTGNIGMTDYLIGKEGGREGLVYRMEWQNGYSGISYMGIGGNNLFAKYMKICHSYGEGTERYYETEERPEYGFEVEFEDKDHNSRRKYTFHDPFTAAVISGERKMIEYISEKFPEMIWNRCMGQAVVRADEDLTEYLAETFPEVTEQISFRTIYREKNIYLTRKYLEEHNPECEKNIATICSALDEEREWMEPGVVFETAEITVLSTPGYYKMILEMLPNPDIKRRIRRNIIRWILSNRPVVFDWPGEPKEKRREEMSQHREMLEVFLMADTGELENYMENSADNIICQDIIWNAATLAEEFEKCGIEIKIGYIDLYNANWCTGFYEGKIKDYSRIMKYFQPECLKSRTDGFNEALIEKNNVGLIRTAMKEGFIGSENALELYDYAAVQPQINEQILQALIRISLKSRNEIPGRNERRKP